jgi:hypothetical protein
MCDVWLARSSQTSMITYMHVCKIVQVMRNPASVSSRGYLRASLQQEAPDLFKHESKDVLNIYIDIAVRLWLCLNSRNLVRNPPSTSSKWTDQGRDLTTFFRSQFNEAKGAEPKNDRIDSMNMVRLDWYKGIRPDWTDDLRHHLHLDVEKRIVKIFPLRSYVNELAER